MQACIEAIESCSQEAGRVLTTLIRLRAFDRAEEAERRPSPQLRRGPWLACRQIRVPGS